MTFKKYINEAIKKMSDEKIDSFISDKWDGEARTFFYNDKAIMEIAVVLKEDDVLVTKDRKFFHIPAIEDRRKHNLISKILLKYDVKEV
jgi:hypothetical protein